MVKVIKCANKYYNFLVLDVLANNSTKFILSFSLRGAFYYKK